jgi:trehalose 6-phosphate synthase
VAGKREPIETRDRRFQSSSGTLRFDEDQPRIEPSSGGLVTAPAPIMRKHAGCWIGWTGTGNKQRSARCEEYTALLKPPLSAVERDFRR